MFQPTPLLLDVSRTVFRAANPQPTGIDRVERAYVEHFLNRSVPCYFLSRHAGGYAILNRSGMARILPGLLGQVALQRPDLIGRLSRRQSADLRRAQSAVRRAAADRCRAGALGRMLSKTFPSGFHYLNVGHSLYPKQTFERIRNAGAKKIIALIHDLIPLTHPQYTRPGMPERFEHFLDGLIEAEAELIFLSNSTREESLGALRSRGFNPRHVVAYPGVSISAPTHKPTSFARQKFVCLGTIEPRKNHALLLDIWHRLPPDGPELHIIGRRGWMKDEVFRILDSSPLMGRTIFEHGPLSDQEAIGHLATAAALLFPSHTEGFGLPLLEAISLRIPIICSDLPVFREVCQKYATFVMNDDADGWERIVRSGAQPKKETVNLTLCSMTWAQHFKTIESFLYSQSDWT